MKFSAGFRIGLLLLTAWSGRSEQVPPSRAQRRLSTRAQRAPAHPLALHYVRVNDTLVLECSRPYTTLVPEAGKPAMTMWLRMTLRGRRGYREVLNYPDSLSLYCLYHCPHNASVSARGDILRFSVLEGGRIPWEEVRRGQPLPDYAVNELDPWVWDVRYRQYAEYMTADLKVLSRRDRNCFTGGIAGDPEEEYRLLPHWISREQVALRRSHHLPPTRRVLAYSSLSRALATAEAPNYSRGYGFLLLNLLRAWRTHPMPAATAHHLNRSIQVLSAALRKARQTS